MACVRRVHLVGNGSSGRASLTKALFEFHRSRIGTVVETEEEKKNEIKDSSQLLRNEKHRAEGISELVRRRAHKLCNCLFAARDKEDKEVRFFFTPLSAVPVATDHARSTLDGSEGSRGVSAISLEELFLLLVLCANPIVSVI